MRIGRKWWDKQDVGKQFEVMIKEVQCRFDHFIAEIGNGEVVVGHEDDGNNEASSDGRRVEVFGKKRVRVLTVAWSTNGASGNFRAAAVAVSDFLGLARGSVPPRHLPHQATRTPPSRKVLGFLGGSHSVHDVLAYAGRLRL